MNWFRFYTNSLDHPKIQKLPERLFKVWVNILCIARLNEGFLLAIPDIAFRLRKSEDEIGADVAELVKRKLLDETPDGIQPHDWDEYQYDSDDQALRKRKWRAKKKRTGKSPNVVPVHVPSQYRARTEQNRTDKSISPIGEIQKPPPKENQFHIQNKTSASELLVKFPGAEGLPGEPDDEILARCLLLADDSPEVLAGALRRMFLAGKRPATSWAWFPVVLEQYLKRPIQRER